MRSAKFEIGKRWRARYVDAQGHEHTKSFERKPDAQRFIDEVTAAVVTGTYLDPKTARITVAEWCSTWIAGYGTRRASTVRQAEVHVAKIVTALGGREPSAVRPSDVKS